MKSQVLSDHEVCTEPTHNYERCFICRVKTS